MSVQARFYVSKVVRQAHDKEGGEITLNAVGRGPENKSWAKYTPSGTLTMYVTDAGAFAFFDNRLGMEVAMTFEDRPLICEKCHEENKGIGIHDDSKICPRCRGLQGY